MTRVDQAVPATSGAAGAAGPRLTIGKVLDALRPEFPDISLSKIRFLEAEGLIEPERTASGYRTYSQSDIVRLRYVLVAQRDRYWPLKVIRDALNAIDRGLPDPAAESTTARPLPHPPGRDPDVPAPEEVRAPSRLSLTAREIREAAGLDKETFQSLQGFGLIQARPSGHFDEHDLVVAGAARTLSEHGLEARHLRAFRMAADREISLIEQAVVTSRDEVREARAAEIASACLRLHAALVKGALAR
ncbi:MAG TPA: MerR family transcriptional regulator [Dermatophilaceae bacterium]|nr:MerR family transcriptional regulator [Dermatophilaceae bacterium]